MAKQTKDTRQTSTRLEELRSLEEKKIVSIEKVRELRKIQAAHEAVDAYREAYPQMSDARRMMEAANVFRQSEIKNLVDDARATGFGFGVAITGIILLGMEYFT